MSTKITVHKVVDLSVFSNHKLTATYVPCLHTQGHSLSSQSNSFSAVVIQLILLYKCQVGPTTSLHQPRDSPMSSITSTLFPVLCFFWPHHSSTSLRADFGVTAALEGMGDGNHPKMLQWFILCLCLSPDAGSVYFHRRYHCRALNTSLSDCCSDKIFVEEIWFTLNNFKW